MVLQHQVAGCQFQKTFSQKRVPVPGDSERCSVGTVRKTFPRLLLFSTVWFFSSFAASAQTTENPTAGEKMMDTQRTEPLIQDDQEILKIVKKKTSSKFLPGLVAAIAEKGQPLRLAAAGVVKNKSDLPLRSNHKVHLGSCTKAMTTTLIARLVDQGKLDWKTTVIQAAPHLKEVIHQDYHDITFEELLSHQSGLPANARDWWLSLEKPVSEARLDILRDNLKGPMSKNARGKFVYSNLGYMLAGYMAATMEKAPWEKLLRREVFLPLVAVRCDQSDSGECPR